MHKRGAFIEADFTLVRCAGCTFVYVNPRVADDEIPQLYDDVYFAGKGFDRTIDYTGEPHDPDHYRAIVDSAEAIGGPLRAKKVVDIGCGTGYLLSLLLDRGADAIGIDGAASAVAIAAERGLPAFHMDVWALRKARGDQAQYDVAILREVIEHVTDPIGFLRTVKPLLKPGGLFFVTTGNWSLVRRFPGTPYIMPEGHIGYFTPKTLARAFREAGFQPHVDPRNRTWAGWMIPKAKLRSSTVDPVIQLAARAVSAVAPEYGPMPVAFARE